MSNRVAVESRGRRETTGPLVSIVIPTFNRAHLLPAAIDGCLEQTYRNIELIVVNDGSKDDTRRVLDGYAEDPRVRAVHKQNEGIPDTVNRGWSEAKGTYLTWTSDDNRYFPEAIAEMVSYLETNPDVAMVYTDCVWLDEATDSREVRLAGEPETLEEECAPAGCLLFRREVLEEVEPFRKEWKRCHDFDFYHRVHRRFKVARLPKVLYEYRFHENSMSGDHVAHVIEYCELMCTYPENAFRKREIWGRGWREIARSLRREGLPWAAVWYDLRASLCKPRYWNEFLRGLGVTAYQRVVPSFGKTAWRSLKSAL